MVEDELWAKVIKVLNAESVEPAVKLPSSSDEDMDAEAGYLQDNVSVATVARLEPPVVTPRKGGLGKRPPSSAGSNRSKCLWK